MLEGKPAIGANVVLGSPLSAELLSPLSFDFLIVDTQHGAWDDDSTMHAFRSIGLGAAVPIARVRSNDFSAIGRLLDMGAMGIIVPIVNSVEEAEAAAYAVRYPPRGGRSGGQFGTGFLGPDYMDWIDDEVFLAVQIESVQAAERAEEIMAVEGVDGCYIGPNDLSLSMGIDLSTPEGRQAHVAAIRGVVEACRKTGKIPGIGLGDMAAAKRWIDEGCLFVSASSDEGFMLGGAQEALRQLGRLG
jgi:4-hydroxy-2-oxoheptanedioate aldolase